MLLLTPHDEPGKRMPFVGRSSTLSELSQLRKQLPAQASHVSISQLLLHTSSSGLGWQVWSCRVPSGLVDLVPWGLVGMWPHGTHPAVHRDAAAGVNTHHTHYKTCTPALTRGLGKQRNNRQSRRGMGERGAEAG